MVDTLVEDICDEFPELRPPKEEDVVALKRELNYFFTASTRLQNEASARNLGHFQIQIFFTGVSRKLNQVLYHIPQCPTVEAHRQA